MDIITKNKLSDIVISESEIADIQKLTTPKEILEFDVYPRPKIISPEVFTSFDSILPFKDKIRKLTLVPIKDDNMHAIYNSTTDKSVLIEELNKYFSISEIFLLENQFPYWLPNDLEQNIIWIKNSEISEKEILEFITKCAKYLNTDINKLILFERPLKTTSLLVKGTFPAYRHIHFWIKKQL